MLTNTSRTCLLAGTAVLFGVMIWAWKRTEFPRLLQSRVTGSSSGQVILTRQVSRKSPMAPRPVVDLTEDSDTPRKVEILKEIFRSKNDNDPRLDREFNHLSIGAKQALEQEYDELQAESRNERGTIIFLIGRNLTSQRDFDFLHQVISEPPCLSLEDCSKASEESSDASTQVRITLDYPQIVVLKSLEKFLSQHLPSSPESPETKSAIRVLQDATKSQSPVVSNMALSLARHFFPNGS